VTSVELAPATAEEARELTDRIKVAVDGTWELIKRAYLSRTWAALGYTSWDDYCTREFGTSRLRLPREERQEVVASLRDTGMSVRAIAAATGNSTRTVGNDIRQVSQSTTPEPVSQEPSPADLAGEPDDEDDAIEAEIVEEPRKVTGTDGKTYTAKPSPAATPPRAPLPQQFQTAAHELTRVIGRFERLQADDRYRANRSAIANQCLPEVRRAAEVLQVLLSELGQ
jgi:transposase-like protein